MKKLNTNNMKTVASLCWAYTGDVYFRPYKQHALVAFRPYGNLSIKEEYKQKKEAIKAISLEDFRVVTQCCYIYNMIVEHCSVTELRLNKDFFSISCYVGEEFFIIKSDKAHNLFIQHHQDMIDVLDDDAIIKFIKVLKIPSYEKSNKDYVLPMIKLMVKTFPEFAMYGGWGCINAVAKSRSLVFFNKGASGILQDNVTGYKAAATSWTKFLNLFKNIPFSCKEARITPEPLAQAERLYEVVERYGIFIEGFNIAKEVDPSTGKVRIWLNLIPVNAQAGNIIVALFDKHGDIRFRNDMGQEIPADKVAERLVAMANIRQVLFDTHFSLYKSGVTN